MNVKVFANAGEIAAFAGETIISLLNKKPDAVLGFATGASPVPTYQYLVNEHRNGRVSFSDITTFNLDEYCGIPADAPESYSTFMWKNLFSMTDVKNERINFLNGNPSDYATECDRYEQAIAAAGGIDIQLLGVGTNGHIGFNEPGSFFHDIPFAIELTESTKKSNAKYFSDGIVPDYALTMGVGDIMRARKTILIATGESKAKAISAMLKGDVSPACPASILRFHPDTLILLDTSAASLL